MKKPVITCLLFLLISISIYPESESLTKLKNYLYELKSGVIEVEICINANPNVIVNGVITDYILDKEPNLLLLEFENGKYLVIYIANIVYIKQLTRFFKSLNPNTWLKEQ